MSCNSSITFASSDIPLVFRVLSNGLKAERSDGPCVKWLTVQMEQLKKDWAACPKMPGYRQEF